MGKLSRTKGKVFEREFARILREHFGDLSKEDRGVRRGIQSRGGGKEAADVVCDALPHLHFECKHQKTPNVRAALRQAREEKRPGQAAVAVVKFDRGETIVAMDLDAWLIMAARELELLLRRQGER